MRSGQSVIFPYGDVTVLVLRKLHAASHATHARRQEFERARIFCRKNEAELLAIDGYYRTTEDIDASLRNRPIQAWLDGDVLKVAAAE